MAYLRCVGIFQGVFLFLFGTATKDCGDYTYYATWADQELTVPSLNTGDCDLIIKSPSKKQVLLKIIALDQTCCTSIEVFDNDFSFGSFNRQSNLPITLVSYSTALRISFRIRGSKRLYTGFRAMFRQANNCGKRISLINTPKNSFGTPRILEDSSHSLDCYWHILSTRDKKVELTFSNGKFQSCCEYVEILSAGTKRIAKVNTEMPGPSSFISIDNVISIFFHSDSGTNHTAFNVDSKEALCGGTLFVPADKATRAISTPSFLQNLDHNLDCTYRLYAPEYYRIKLTAELNMKNEEDYLEVIDVDDAAIRISGKASRTVTSSHLTLHLHSSHAAAGKGFRATYRLVQIPCNHSYKAKENYQKITSLGHPHQYPSGIVCNWILEASEGSQVILLLRDLDTEQCCDYVEIFDGETLLGRYSGTISTDIGFSSSAGTLRVLFQPNADITRDGFSAIFKEGSNCGTSFTATRNGTLISTPDYPSNYVSNLGCHWRIRSERSLQLQFDVLAGGTERCCDSLQILDDTIHLARLVGDFETPATFLSTSHYMSIYFHTDASTNREGFIGEVKEVCKYTYHVSYQFYFAAYSPHYPGDSPNDLHCEYTFIPESKNGKIELLIKILDTEACCDSIEISDDTSSRGKFQGFVAEQRVGSLQGTVKLLYQTNEKVRSKGFEIWYRLI